MSGLFAPDAFAGFGPSRLEAAIPGGCRVDGRRSSQLKARVRQECPRSPGVYGMVDAHGDLIYVGKAKSLRTRLLSYFRAKGRPPKAGRIVGATRQLIWEYASSEFGALLRELELIRRWRPVGNVQGQPQRFRRTYVCLGRRPAPYVFLSRQPSRHNIASWGPVFASKQSREAVRRINDWFGLRDCPQPQEMVFADQGELFPVLRTAGCIRLELNACVGPCAAACSEAQYLERVQGARRFLDGANLEPLQKLEADMKQAAAQLAFERAAALHEKLTVLTWLHEHLERVRQARRLYHFIYPMARRNGPDLWYLIRRGWVAGVIPAPADAASRTAAAAAIEAAYHPSAHIASPAWSEEIDGVFLVAAWFRRQPKELQRTFSPEEALARC